MRLVASADLNWGIGLGGELLFRTKADMTRLREMTMGNVLLMGGRTFRSLPNGALPGRVNVVLTRCTFQNKKCGGIINDAVTHMVSSVDEALSLLSHYPDKECFLFGGGEIYRAFLPYCSRADITRYAHSSIADTFLPRLDQLSGWKQLEKSERYNESGLSFWFETWLFGEKQ